MGTVYRAERRGEVAIKVVHPHLIAAAGFFKRFLREAELGRRISHQNVVRALDADLAETDAGIVHYLVMERCCARSRSGRRRPSVWTRMETRFRLWQRTRDRSHLEEAGRLLDLVVANAPEEDRAAMVASVPLHRAIAEARRGTWCPESRGVDDAAARAVGRAHCPAGFTFASAAAAARLTVSSSSFSAAVSAGTAAPADGRAAARSSSARCRTP